MTRVAIGIAMVTGIFLLPAPAHAQAGAPATPASIDQAVSSGKRVAVQLKNGHEVNGTVFTVSAEALELIVDTRKEVLAAADISSIKVRFHDRLSDGAKNGALTGLVMGGILGIVGAASDCGSNSHFLNFCSPGGFALLGVVFGGYGMGIGAAAGLLGDALRMSNRVVWRAPLPANRMSVQALTSRGAGARLVFTW